MTTAEYSKLLEEIKTQQQERSELLSSFSNHTLCKEIYSYINAHCNGDIFYSGKKPLKNAFAKHEQRKATQEEKDRNKTINSYLKGSIKHLAHVGIVLLGNDNYTKARIIQQIKDKVKSDSIIQQAIDAIRTPISGEIFCERDPIRYSIVDFGDNLTKYAKSIDIYLQRYYSLIVLVIPLDDYDKFLENGSNKLLNTLHMFEEMLEKYKEQKIFVLCFSKLELFTEKIKQEKLNICFPDYEETSKKIGIQSNLLKTNLIAVI